MLKLLFIDDQLHAIKPLQNLIEREKIDLQYDVCEYFDQAADKIKSTQPDIVILDLLFFEGSSDLKAKGMNVREFIWNEHFCPIIVYSAQPDIHEEEHTSHPFVKCIQKGRGSPSKVMEALEELRPNVEALKEAKEIIQNAFSLAMRDVAPYAFKAFSNNTQRIEETLKRSGRRRVAALMDEPLPDGRVLAAWEQYLFPPVGNDIQLGDVLRKKDCCNDNPTSFRVVLTPSCDLATPGGRLAKVSNVLVARCCKMKEAIGLTSLGNIGFPKLKNRLRSQILTQGFFEGIIPFPGLEDRIPTMAAKFRDLELIPFEDIGSSKLFVRVASLDSPFRELIAWAYLQTACRPGLPDRDFDSWRKEITENLRSEDGGEKHESL